MASIVEEIQRAAIDPNISAANLLLKCKIVASKLKLTKLADWAHCELNGYNGDSDEIPKYRRITGQARVRTPRHGYQPIMFEDAKIEEDFCHQYINHSISEIEAIASTGNGMVVQLNGQQAHLLCSWAKCPTLPVQIFFPANMVRGLVDNIKSKILDWALLLEDEGIMGEGLSFSEQEKIVAQKPVVNIRIDRVDNYHSNVGNSVGGNFNGNSSQSSGMDVQKIKELIALIGRQGSSMDLTPDAETELRSNVDALAVEIESPQPKRGKIMSALGSVKAIAEGATGNVIAAGVGSLAASLM